MTLLQGAVSALSLADKCALSLSLGNSRIQSPNDFEVTIFQIIIYFISIFIL